METNTTMESQKEQNPLTTRNNSRIIDGVDNTVTLCSVRNDIDRGLNKEFHFREVVAWIMSRMHLEFDKKYKLSEIINNVLETGNQIESVKGKYFDSDLYLGVKDQITTDFRKHVLLNILVEDESKRESLGYILDHLNDEVSINEAVITSHITVSETEYNLKLYYIDQDNLNIQIAVIRIPY